MESAVVQLDNLGTLISNAMATLIRCISSNGLLVKRDGFLPDLEQKKMVAIANQDGAAVDFKQMRDGISLEWKEETANLGCYFGLFSDLLSSSCYRCHDRREEAARARCRSCPARWISRS
ncbi:hypothetical protein ACLOJK_004708 [Asimina triloba]